MNDEQLLEAWMRYYQKEKPSEDDPDAASVNIVNDLAYDDPERLYVVADMIVQKTDDQRLLALLGAGPLEDLLCGQDAETFVDRILDNARRDPKWRYALGCVWPGRAENKMVKARLETAINQYFPDGTP